MLGHNPRRPSEELAALAELFGLRQAYAGLHGVSNLTPQRSRLLVLSELERFTLSCLGRQHTLVLFADLHWADPTTLELLHRVVAQLIDLRIFDAGD